MFQPDEFSDDAKLELGADAPIEQRLAFGQPLHDKILGRLTARLELADKHIKTRYDDWDRADESCRMFIDLSRKARRPDKNSTDDGKREMPFQRAIVIPVSYATHQVRLTQLVSLFGYREPPFQLDGSGPEDVRPAKLMEAVLAYDARQTRFIAWLHSLMQDADKYGIGVSTDFWQSDYGYAPMQLPPFMRQAMSRLGVAVPKVWRQTKEYNSIQTIDPFLFWPDPRVSMSNIQAGEFWAYRVFRGYMHLLERSGPDGIYFNIDQLQKAGAGGTKTGRTGRARMSIDESTMMAGADDKDRGFFALDHYQVRLIPKEWELGENDRPEIWWFSTADEAVIIRANPNGYDHGQFTLSVAEVNPDPHTMFNPGTVENLDGIQRVSNWLWNSHIENQIKILNDVLIILPTLVEMDDILNPGPARHIRLTPEGERLVMERGLDPATFVRQLNVADVTGGHLETANMLFEMAQRMSAANDPAMGQPLDKSRTLGEVQSILASGSQRISVTARVIDAQAITPMVERLISNRQQFTTGQQYFRIAGDLARELGGNPNQLIGLSDLMGNFDYVPHSGVLPADPARDAGTWANILEIAAKAPQLLQPTPDGKILDVQEIFNEWARRAGARNIEQFYRNAPPPMPPQLPPGTPGGPPQVMPDDQVQRQLAAGNLVPMPPGAMGPH